MRYFIELSYKGTAYCGWQRQPNAPSVQETIERSLTTLLRQPITIVGAGRTDTGVHASFYIAHFECDTNLDLRQDFKYHLNCHLPEDITIHAIRHVADDAHARFDARQREYKYYILTEKNSFNRELTWQYRSDLDIEKMNAAAATMLTHNDFATFSKLGSDNKTTLCKIYVASWERQGNSLTFTIRADRFLRNMVRSIVGTLVDVGRGKLSAEQFQAIMESGDRSQASASAPAQGLFLTDVTYLI